MTQRKETERKQEEDKKIRKDIKTKLVDTAFVLALV